MANLFDLNSWNPAAAYLPDDQRQAMSTSGLMNMAAAFANAGAPQPAGMPRKTLMQMLTGGAQAFGQGTDAYMKTAGDSYDLQKKANDLAMMQQFFGTPGQQQGGQPSPIPNVSGPPGAASANPASPFGTLTNGMPNIMKYGLARTAMDSPKDLASFYKSYNEAMLPPDYMAKVAAMEGGKTAATQSQTVHDNQTMTMPDGSIRQGVMVRGDGTPIVGSPVAPVPMDNSLPQSQPDAAFNPQKMNASEFLPPIPARQLGLPQGPQAMGASVPTQQPPSAAHVGYNPAAKAKADATATAEGGDLAGAKKTLAIMHANLPVMMQRLDEMHNASDNADWGPLVDSQGGGIQPALSNLNPKSPTAIADQLLQQRSAQGVLSELGPQLAQAGIRGNKFLEQIASSASGIDMSKNRPARGAAVEGLRQQYISNLASTINQVRNMGGEVPQELIDAYNEASKKYPRVDQFAPKTGANTPDPQAIVDELRRRGKIK